MPIKPISRLLLTVCAVFFITAAVRAAAPIVHLTPKPAWLLTYKPYDKSIPLRDVEDGFFYQLFEEQIHVEQKARYTHIIRQIVSEAGIQNGSEISIGFDPTFEKLEVHQITVWRDNKPQNRLSARAFKIIADEKELSKFIYQGTYSAYCILADIRKGDRIEYAYTITGRNPIFGDKFCSDLYLQLSKPIAHLYKSLLASPARKLNFKSFNKLPQTLISEKNKLKCYEWDAVQVKPATDYTDQAGWYTNYGYIQVSDYSSWEEVANWALKINPIATNLSGQLAKQVALFKAASGNDKEKYFRNAVKMVQDEVRYMGIEMGQYSHRANNPEKVYNQRYGDCKDKSLLLASVLNAGGIPASMVLISSTSKSNIDQYLPSPFVFDHATVVATVNNRQVWIDPTIAYQRGTGINLYYPAYGKGLVLKPGNNALTTIPLSKPGEITCHENYKVLNDTGKVSLDVVTTYTLNEADKIRNKLATVSMAETEKSYLDYYARSYPKIESADSITVADDADKNEVTTTEHYLIAGFFKKDSTTNKYRASFYADYISEQLPDVNNRAKYPVALYYPYAIDYTISVVLPGGWNIPNSNTNIKRDAYLFASKISAVNDTLFLNYKFSYLKNEVPVNKLDEFRADVKQIKDGELSYAFSYKPDSTNSTTTFRVNYPLAISVMVFVLLIGGIGAKIYHTETSEIIFEPGANFKPLGGWLILIAIALGASCFLVTKSLSDGVCFSLDRWNAYAGTDSNYSFKVLLTFEIFGNALLVCYSLFCLILLLNKRDILPRYIIGFYIFALAFHIGDYSFTQLFFNETSSESSTYVIFRSILISAIWISYFMRSSRVHETFIVPYPASNYSYEEWTTPRATKLESADKVENSDE